MAICDVTGHWLKRRFISPNPDKAKNQLGPLNVKTVASIENFKKIYPNCKVEHNTLSSEGEPTQEQFEVSCGKISIDILTPGVGSSKIANVIIHSPAVQLPEGFHVDATLKSLLKFDPHVKCYRQLTEETADDIVCTSKKIPNFGFMVPIADEEEKSAWGTQLKTPLHPHGRRCSVNTHYRFLKRFLG